MLIKSLELKLVKYRVHLFSILMMCSLIGCDRCSDSIFNNKQIHTNEKSKLFLYVAASLADISEVLIQRYKMRYPQREVHLIVAGSHHARSQLERGAPSGVFISAAQSHINQLKKHGLVVSEHSLAYNHLVIVTRAELNIHKLSQLSQKSQKLRWGIADQRVPLGKLSWSLLRDLNISGQPLSKVAQAGLVTQSPNARILKGRVVRDEVDVAVLYYTDSLHLKGWHIISLPDELKLKYRTQYVFAITRGALNDVPSEAALEFQAMLMNSETQRLFKKFSFMPYLYP